MSKIKSLLTSGLLNGFAGKTRFQSIERAGVDLQLSHFDQDADVYHDEWAANRTGGGQELAVANGKTYTRVYAGGTVSISELEKLGVNKKLVMEFLISSLNQAGEATRLHTDFGPIQNGDWTYHYKILERNDEIPMTTGKEDISYKGKVIFTHVFVMCPVE
jgi:hypothetical protein